jgi:dTMP kinase
VNKFAVRDPRHHGLKGRFIVIEGPDGAGKSTQVRRLKDRLGERAPQVELCVTSEPWMSYWGKEIREKAARGERMNPEAEMYTFLADRQEHLNQLILPSLEAGDLVLTDRYYLSSVVYQGVKGFDPVRVRRLNERFVPRPDLTLLLCLQPEEAWARVQRRGGLQDAFHKKETVEDVARAYLELECPSISRVMVDDMSVEEVTDELWARMVWRWSDLDPLDKLEVE